MGCAAGQDADGFLNKDDLKKLLGNQEDVDQLIAAADTNGDGKARPRPGCPEAEGGILWGFRVFRVLNAVLGS